MEYENILTMQPYLASLATHREMHRKKSNEEREWMRSINDRSFAVSVSVF